MAETFGAALRRARERRGWSQLALALHSGVSQRQISFLETGRSAPGRDTVARLAAGLALGRLDAAGLFRAAGYAVPSMENQSVGAAGGPSLEAAIRLTRYQRTAPAVLIDLAGYIKAANALFEGLVMAAGQGDDLWQRTHAGGPRNLFLLSFHPDGLVPLLQNRQAVAAAYRARMEAASGADAVARPLLEALAGRGRPDGPPPGAPVAERYRFEGRALNLLAVTSHISTPGSGEGLRLETYLPDDPDSERFLGELAARVG